MIRAVGFLGHIERLQPYGQGAIVTALLAQGSELIIQCYPFGIPLIGHFPSPWNKHAAIIPASSILPLHLFDEGFPTPCTRTFNPSQSVHSKKYTLIPTRLNQL